MRRDRGVDFLLCAYIIGSLLLMALIFYFSSLPAVQSQAESDVILMHVLEGLKVNPTDEDLLLYSFLIRKSAHFGIYTILGGMLVLAFSRYYRSIWASINMWIPARRLLLPLVVALLYAASDEFHQTFVLGRSGELRDWVIDAAGSVLGIIFAGYLFIRVHGEERF